MFKDLLEEFVLNIIEERIKVSDVENPSIEDKLSFNKTDIETTYNSVDLDDVSNSELLEITTHNMLVESEQLSKELIIDTPWSGTVLEGYTEKLVETYLGAGLEEFFKRSETNIGSMLSELYANGDGMGQLISGEEVTINTLESIENNVKKIISLSVEIDDEDGLGVDLKEHKFPVETKTKTFNMEK